MITDSKPAGLYIHVPFCRSKCGYCDFYSIPSLDLAAAWLKALEKEALLYSDRFARFDSLYIGGGTPTVLEARQLAELMACLYRHFYFFEQTEITIEANPNDLTLDKLQLLKGLGVNRISLGAQSFDDNDLTFLGRRHRAGQTAKALELIQSCGFHNVGLDLIYGLPGQTETRWLKIMEEAVAFAPDHCSCYQLTLEKGTPLGKLEEKGVIKPIDEEKAGRFFLMTSQFLEDHGYIHYEISNFARAEKAFSRHNQKYWAHIPYLGLGPAAHSFQDNHRWWNGRSVEQYCRLLEEGNTPVAGRETLSEEQMQLEKIALLLRTKTGIAIEDLKCYSKGETVLTELVDNGYVNLVNGRVVPTREGFLIADRLPLLFFD